MIHMCFVSVAVAIILSVVIRWVVKKTTHDKHLLLHVDEFIGNFISAVFMLELFVISSKRGSNSMESVVCGFIHLFFKHIYFMNKRLYGTPLSFVDIFYSNRRKRLFSVFEVISIIATQIISLLAGQRFAKLIWSLSKDDFHAVALEGACSTTLSPSFTWQYAFFIEAAGIFICTMIDFFTPVVLKPLVRSCVTLTLLWNYGHVSGLWMNPVLATLFTFRCKGHSSDWQHIMVYWVGPTISFFLAWELKLLLDSVSVNKEVSAPIKTVPVSINSRPNRKNE